MTEHEHIENTLRNAPRPPVPPDLRDRLRREVDISFQKSSGLSGTRRVIYSLTPLLSVAASAAVLAVIAAAFFWPSPVAYSFEKSLAAFDRVSSIRIVHEFRHGPSHTTDLPGGGKMSTTHHPANPIIAEERTFAVSNGRPLFHSRTPYWEVVRNGPLSLEVDFESGERRLTLAGSRYMDRELLVREFLEKLETDALTGAIDFEVTGRKDARGNMEIEILDYSHPDHPDLMESTILRLYVEPDTFFPVRLDIWETSYPEYGSEVLMNRIEVVEYDFPVDYDLFEIEVTEEELAWLGVEREELGSLPLDAVLIEIEGETGLGFRGYLLDENGRTPVAGTVPERWIATPAGDFILYLETESGERGDFNMLLGDRRHRITGPSHVAAFSYGSSNGVFGISPVHEDPEVVIRNHFEGRR